MAKLDQATQIAQKLSLTASNARAVALRAGERAAGFRSLTGFIDRLAEITISSSKRINQLAAILSQTSAEKVRADVAIKHFNAVYLRAKDSPYIHSLDDTYQRCSVKQQALASTYKRQIDQLNDELAMLSS